MDFDNEKRNTGRGGVQIIKKKLKIFKKTFQKSVDEVISLVVYYRCNRSKGFRKEI